MFLLTMILVVGVPWGSLFWNRLGKVSGGGTPKARAVGELRQLWPKVVAQASSTAIYPPALSRSALHNQATNFSISEKRPPWHLASFKELIDYNQNSFYLNWNIFLRTGINHDADRRCRQVTSSSSMTLITNKTPERFGYARGSIS